MFSHRQNPNRPSAHQSHRTLPTADDELYQEAERKARKQHRKSFRDGFLRQIDCLDDLWDSDPDGPPPEWIVSSNAKKGKSRGENTATVGPATPPPTQRASGSRNGG